jgi:hypothetical protein
MDSPHMAWETKRKVWHILGNLALAALYCSGQYFFRSETWQLIAAIILWLATIFLIGLDWARFKNQTLNKLFISLPFFGSIIRPKEHAAFNASTYCFLALAIIATAINLGWATEYSLISAIMVLALCDPAASFGRQISSFLPSLVSRLIGALFFFLAALIILNLLGLTYGLQLTFGLAFIAKAVALAEAFLGQLWNAARSRLKNSSLIHPPGWLVNFYPDDNLTAPLLLVFLLSCYGY